MHKKFGYRLDGDRIKGITKLYNPITGKKIGKALVSYCFYSTLE